MDRPGGGVRSRGIDSDVRSCIDVFDQLPIDISARHDVVVYQLGADSDSPRYSRSSIAAHQEEFIKVGVARSSFIGRHAARADHITQHPPLPIELELYLL